MAAQHIDTEVSVALLVKLASIVVHVQEALSPGAHQFDGMVLRTLVNDPEVTRWIASLGPLAPVRRAR